MSGPACGDCRHFRVHYIRRGYRYEPISDGHCVHPRLKRRESATPACPHFSERKSTRPG